MGPMKLTDLNPRWCATSGRQGQGVTFDCPHCRKARLVVFFANPLDGGTPLPHWGSSVAKEALAVFTQETDLALKGVDVVPPGFHWQRTGETLETLTLAPSVDASASGHWHGFLRDGEIRSC